MMFSDTLGGKQVFENVFKAYCPSGFPLSRRTLPEILRMAATFKELLMPQRQRNEDDEELAEEDDGGEVPSYIRDIPNLDLLQLL
jgi:hypothetical protein